MVLFELPAGANDTKKSVAKANVAALLDRAHAMRCPGPAALDIAWVAAGSADVFFHSGIHCWDMAAGKGKWLVWRKAVAADKTDGKMLHFQESCLFGRRAELCTE